MSLQERIKSSRKLRKEFPSRAFCKSCNTPYLGNNFKYIFFNQISLYGPICLECFNDEDVSFSKIIEYYTNRGTYEHEGFSEKEIDYYLKIKFKIYNDDQPNEVVDRISSIISGTSKLNFK